MINEMDFKMPGSVKELLPHLGEANENTFLISGGTDLIIKLREKNIYTGVIIDLKGISELNYIKQVKDYICIGANTTFTEITNSQLIRDNALCLALAAGQIGSTQIRNSATLGGNVANAFAGADAIPALAAMGAKIKVINSKEELYEKDIDEIVLGLGKNSLKKDETIIEILIPLLGDQYRSQFGKIGSRERVTISKLNMAVVVNVNPLNKIIEDARVVLGALGPKAFRSSLAEKALAGKIVDDSLCREFQDSLVELVDLAIAGRSSRPYKREAVKGLAEEVFNKLFASDLPGGGKA